ncbi:MAG: hypothetical protein IPP69_05895 [Flavobacteriales bacterium]|nr:hypothetical protein [Flavobacteriales bacterium]
MNRSTFTLVALLVSYVSIDLFSQDQAFLQSGKLDHLAGVTLQQSKPKAAACAPATALRDLEWNNIDALIETGGSLWQDRANGRSHYYAPQSGVNSVLFAGSLWLGGVSPDQQLKLAALQYRYSGNDYWPGPLTNDGTAETNSSSCLQWDKFSVSLRTDAAMHRAYFECLNDPNCDLSELLPDGYVIPSYFMEYPAHGNLAAGQDFMSLHSMTLMMMESMNQPKEIILGMTSTKKSIAAKEKVMIQFHCMGIKPSFGSLMTKAIFIQNPVAKPLAWKYAHRLLLSAQMMKSTI